jgi:Fe-S-cluster containining protein
MPRSQPKIGDLYGSYEEYLSDVDKEFHRVYQIFEDRMQCRRGCSSCCSQMFSISLLEAAYISRAIKALPDDMRRLLRVKAEEYVDAARDLIGTDESDAEETVVPKPGVRLPCPALLGDACTIYGARPIICHKWGIPIFNPKNPLQLQACDLNFKAGEEIEIEGLLEPQIELLEAWVNLKKRVQIHSGKVPTATVAEAILHDYEEILLGTEAND